MVPTITGPRCEGETVCRRAWIVEIVGPAGAGKSTLFHALAAFDPGIRPEFLPPVWNSRYIPFFVNNIFLLAPKLVRLRGKGDRSLTRRELAWMAMLQGWPEILQKKAAGGAGVLLLDQGPIFLMTTLSAYGPASLRNGNIQGYWKDIQERWIHTLDMVIWLDAPDEILMGRIRNRGMDHPVKDKTDQEIKDFLGKYRAAYERLIHTMMANNHEIKVVRLDTGKNSPDDLVRCAVLNLPVGNGKPSE